LSEAEAKLPVMHTLYSLGGISRQELDDAEAAVTTATIALERAQENVTVAERKAELVVKKAEQQVATVQTKLNELQKAASQLTVIAPRNARVLEAPTEPGQRFNRG